MNEAFRVWGETWVQDRVRMVSERLTQKEFDTPNPSGNTISINGGRGLNDWIFNDIEVISPTLTEASKGVILRSPGVVGVISSPVITWSIVDELNKDLITIDPEAQVLIGFWIFVT